MISQDNYGKRNPTKKPKAKKRVRQPFDFPHTPPKRGLKYHGLTECPSVPDISGRAMS